MHDLAISLQTTTRYFKYQSVFHTTVRLLSREHDRLCNLQEMSRGDGPTVKTDAENAKDTCCTGMFRSKPHESSSFHPRGSTFTEKASNEGDQMNETVKEVIHNSVDKNPFSKYYHKDHCPHCPALEQEFSQVMLSLERDERQHYLHSISS